MPPAVTGQLLIDLDDSGAYATNLCAAVAGFPSGFWKMENGFSLKGRGRRKENDAAQMASMVCRLDNSDGRFTPRNTGGAYYPNFTTYKQAKVKLTYNAVTMDAITGTIAEIKVTPHSKQQLCEITIRDFMFLLARTEVRRPLMRSQYTGVIINRLLDDVEGAESREGVSNPRFETNTTGYAGVGTGVLTRIVGGEKNLEGPASMNVTTTGAVNGVRYTMTGKAGEKWTLVAYVKPETDADIGFTVRIKMADDLATGPNGGYQAMANRDYWTRLEVSGTFTVGSTTQWIYLEAALACSFRVGAVHAVPYVNAIARDIDDGQTVIPYFSEYRGKALEAIQRVRHEEMFALFYFNGSGTAVFEDRHHRWRESRCLTPQSTFDERGILEYSEHGDDRIKSVHIDYPVHVEGTAGTVLGSIDRTIPLAPGFTIPVELDYQEGMARDVIVPVVNTDYTINSSGTGDGTDQSGSVTVTFEDQGSGARATFLNGSSRTVYLRTYQVRGTPIRIAADRVTATSTDSGGPALAAELSFGLDYAGETVAQAGAEYLSGRYSDQQERMAAAHSAAFPEAATTSDMTAILARTVSDRVRYTNDNLPFSLKITARDYYVDSIDLKCTGESMDVNWRLSPVDGAYGIWDTSTWDNAVFAP